MGNRLNHIINPDKLARTLLIQKENDVMYNNLGEIVKNLQSFSFTLEKLPTKATVFYFDHNNPNLASINEYSPDDRMIGFKIVFFNIQKVVYREDIHKVILESRENNKVSVLEITNDEGEMKYQVNMHMDQKYYETTLKTMQKNMNKQITVFAGAVLNESKDRVLMVLRSEPELPEAHLKWEFPGGKVDFGETPEEALIREFKEETGRTIKVSQLLPFVQTSYWKYADGMRQTLCFVFLCELVKDVEPKKKDHHVEKAAWIPIDEVEKLDSLPGTKEIIKLVRKGIESREIY